MVRLCRRNCTVPGTGLALALALSLRVSGLSVPAREGMSGLHGNVGALDKKRLIKKRLRSREIP